ncbi:MAG: hypothetical protein J0M15_09340 [Deltaproteobacteria bacterium]|nr:hypothetical protein [Deltaproteobacteria bacterium]
MESWYPSLGVIRKILKKIILNFIFILSLFYSHNSKAQMIGQTPGLNPSMNIFSMNLHCFAGNWQFRFEQILNKILELSPDVISLQEVCTTFNGNLNQIEFIKKYLMDRRYPLQKIVAQFTHPAWNQFNEYLVVITKQNVLAVDQGLLPTSELQRGYIAIKLNPFWYINTHLEYKMENSAYRQMQIDFLIQRFLNEAHVIGGDFNSAPDSQEQFNFKRMSYLDFFPGNTFIGDDSNSSRRIDGMWFSPKARMFLKTLNGGITLDQKVNGQYLSDHFAIYSLLTFQLPYRR